jgi:hypothetical protein
MKQGQKDKSDLRRALAFMWKMYAHTGTDPIVHVDEDAGYGQFGRFTVSPRNWCEMHNLAPICDAADDGTWGDTPLAEYESGEEFADMAIEVFGDELLGQILDVARKRRSR